MKIMLFCPPLVHPRLDRDSMKISPPLAIYHLGAILLNAGYDVTIHDPVFVKKYYHDTWDETLLDEFVSDYDFIGISTNSFNWGIAKEFIDIVKARSQSPFVVCGGVHVSLFSQHIMQQTQVDAIIREDGEEALLQLVKAVENGTSFEAIPNLIYRYKGSVVVNEVRLKETLPDLLPGYQLIPDRHYYSLPVETSRGCPFDCPFCAILYLRKWRSLNNEQAIERIHQAIPFLQEKSTANSMLFTDDEFNIKPERSKALFQILNEWPEDFRCHFTARVTDFIRDPDLAKMIPRSKISTIQMGVECGYEEGLKRVKQQLSFEDINACFKLLEKEDLAKYCLVSFIVGFPWETIAECETTIQYALMLEDKYNIVTIVNWWMPLKSQLWDQQKERGFHIPDNAYDNPLWPTDRDLLHVVHPNISYEEIRKLTDKYGDYISHLLDMV